ncbi:MAG: hypothetical protein KDJ99_22695, partial [Candidatus Competibacteraceae bacterium]|nr:hypothetical protein [Candidatus Competibacteraceae bacterium]
MATDAFVTTTLNYSVDNGIPPDYYFYEPDPSVQQNPPGTDPQEVRIHNAWSQRDHFTADREGFEIKPFDDDFDQFHDDELIQ